jgi:hypothetical protein
MTSVKLLSKGSGRRSSDLGVAEAQRSSRLRALVGGIG